MEAGYIEESSRERLILSGLCELEEYGLSGFSLRRAALRAQVSCAAPYRHFKDKDDYILQIVKYVNSKWQLLAKEIKGIFKSNPKRLAIEMSMANLRFWIANANYRTVFTLALDCVAPYGSAELDRDVVEAVELYSNDIGLSESESRLKAYSVRTLILGTVMLVASGDEREYLSLARERLEREFA